MVSYHPRPGSEPANRASSGPQYPDTLRRRGRLGVQNLYYSGPSQPGIMGI
jgi:hypothetical protein